MKKIRFEKQKVASFAKVSGQILQGQEINLGMTGDDYIHETLTAQLEAFLFARLNEEQTIIVFVKRPTFFDWLFRRGLTAEVKIKCNEVLKNPPEISESILLYEVNQG